MRTSLFFAAACLMATLTAGIELQPVNTKRDEVMGVNGITKGVDTSAGPSMNQATKIFGGGE